ncbi:hypothetical protein ACN47E_007524 [Coniothyrium glycines]
MAEATSAGGVQGDLERELTCSICTDVLYHPLTLLDCLHTFCGACLKEWFAFQAATATSLHPYTCPACRASVRSTQPNATVTTLLDIFLRANPGRGKSEAERKADRDRFRPGDSVLPKLRRRDGSRDARPSRAPPRSPSRDARPSRVPPRSPSRDARPSRTARRSPSHTPVGTSPARAAVPPRAIEHQSSLRSLLSASELDAGDVDEDLVHQVLEELMAEGMDLTQIGLAQEEEITERIAEAVRRRQADRQAERQRDRRERRDRLARDGLPSASSPSLALPLRSPAARSDDEASRRLHGRPESGTVTPQSAAGPPISRPGLIDAANRSRPAHRLRSSSQGSARAGARTDRPAALSAQLDTGTERPSASGTPPATRRRQSDLSQGSRLDARQQFRNALHTASTPNSPREAGFNISLYQDPDPASNNTAQPPISAPAINRSTTEPSAHNLLLRQSPVDEPLVATQYTEPSISCQRCGVQDIQYDLHYNCSRCDDGAYDLCLRCYQTGRGCNHWFGFGWTAWERYERQAPEGGYPPDHDHPHILIGHRYRRPTSSLTESITPPYLLQSDHDPADRLEAGVFCDMCKTNANACYWKCDYCNNGDWGYCNDCVNTGRHCTHPLTPVATQERRTSSNNDTSPSAPPAPQDDTFLKPLGQGAVLTTPPSTPKSASIMRGPGYFTIAKSIFRPLTFTTLCNVCSSSIPPSHTRYHCLKCNSGDYDVCMSCYHKLVVSGRISKEDGINGWRKCLRGHRMVVVGFEDRNGGQRRIVVRELVGGYALKDDEEKTANSSRLSRFPPDGGAGLRLTARWGYWPEEGVVDEVAFPRGAELREAADINGDWYWGVYCGTKGLFPASYVVPT